MVVCAYVFIIHACVCVYVFIVHLPLNVCIVCVHYSCNSVSMILLCMAVCVCVCACVCMCVCVCVCVYACVLMCVYLLMQSVSVSDSLSECSEKRLQINRIIIIIIIVIMTCVRPGGPTHNREHISRGRTPQGACVYPAGAPGGRSRSVCQQMRPRRAASERRHGAGPPPALTSEGPNYFLWSLNSWSLTVCRHTHDRTRTRAHTIRQACAHTQMCMHAHLQTSTHTHVCTCRHPHKHACAHTHTHKRTL